MAEISTLTEPTQDRPSGARAIAKKFAASTKEPVRGAKNSDIDLIHARLMEAIETSPYYSGRFKEFEKQRLNKAYLRTLISTDPFHVMIILANDEPAGFMITSPQYGALWLHWSYIFPEKRRASLAMSSLRSLIKHYDNGKFHKIATYTKPGNPAVALLHRFKFDLTCTLKNHIFGEDYLLYELPLVKTKQGYDMGTGLGRIGRLKLRVRSLLKTSSE